MNQSAVHSAVQSAVHSAVQSAVLYTFVLCVLLYLRGFSMSTHSLPVHLPEELDVQPVGLEKHTGHGSHGPDLLGSLFGVLQRFRLGAIALMADIESMFHQVRVSKEDTDALRFLWKTDTGQPGSPSVYKMMLHIFGAADSPCCANYALRRTALDNKDTCSSLATQSVLQNFYVDDLLTSVGTPNVAISLYKELTELLAKGGFHLHKWTSNSTLVMQSIPQSERTIQDVSLAINQLTIQRALGHHWNLAEDCFVFNPPLKEVPQTKRGVVSIVSSIFDPCGYLSPFTLRAKCLTQELWRQRVDWDEPLPSIKVTSLHGPKWWSPA